MKANFRDLNGAVTRMATFASGGRITLDIVHDEMKRLSSGWRSSEENASVSGVLDAILSQDQIDQIDPFERPQLEHVITVCKNSRSLSDAGRKLFAVSRERKKNKNDADRLIKYLSRFSIEWRAL
ncbi:MAG: hypothetical protein AABZ10_00190 [Nitrospirota bacterium]